MKKSDKRKTNLKISILLLLLLLVLLIVSTYAWFTANKTVTVSDIEIYVASSNGLQISVDGTTWKTIITSEDILNASETYSAAVNQIPDYDEGEVAQPVSSVLETDSDTGYMNMYLGNVASDETTGDYILTATQTVEDSNNTSGDFVVFDIFLKVDQGTTIDLTSESYVKAVSDSVGLENAARVAFVYEGHVETGTTVATIQALKEASDVILWEPNYDTHTAAGAANASEVYGITTELTNGSLLSYYGVKAEISEGVSLDSTDETYFSEVTPTISTTKSFSEGDQTFVELEAGITKFRVYMWVEGQDVDCENNASGSGIVYNVQFTIAD